MQELHFLLQYKCNSFFQYRIKKKQNVGREMYSYDKP